MRALPALGLVLWAGVFAAPLFAGEGVACLRSQLNDLGFAAGATGTAIDPELQRAALDWADARALPVLSGRTAMTWCRDIGQSRPALQRHWPSREPPVILTQTSGTAAMLRKDDADVRAFFKDCYGIELAGRIALVGTGDVGTLDALRTAALIKLGRSTRAKPLDTERFCRDGKIGGAANRGYMLFCWPGADETPEWQADTAAALRKVMAHEYVHQVQYALAADDPAQKLDGAWLLRPHWFVEGMAEVIEWQFDTGAALADGVALFDLQSPARRSRATLAALSPHGTVAGSSDYGVARFAVFLLVQRHGMDALFDYLRDLGRGLPPEDAFTARFGMSSDAYSALFETLRRDYGAARRYGREGTE